MEIDRKERFISIYRGSKTPRQNWTEAFLKAFELRNKEDSESSVINKPSVVFVTGYVPTDLQILTDMSLWIIIRYFFSSQLDMKPMTLCTQYSKTSNSRVSPTPGTSTTPSTEIRKIGWSTPPSTKSSTPKPHSSKSNASKSSGKKRQKSSIGKDLSKDGPGSGEVLSERETQIDHPPKLKKLIPVSKSINVSLDHLQMENSSQPASMERPEHVLNLNEERSKMTVEELFSKDEDPVLRLMAKDIDLEQVTDQIGEYFGKKDQEPNQGTISLKPLEMDLSPPECQPSTSGTHTQEQPLVQIPVKRTKTKTKTSAQHKQPPKTVPTHQNPN